MQEHQDLETLQWSTGSVDPSYMLSCGILKCLDSDSIIIWASNGGSVINLRPLSLAGARPWMVQYIGPTPKTFDQI